MTMSAILKIVAAEVVFLVAVYYAFQDLTIWLFALLISLILMGLGMMFATVFLKTQRFEEYRELVAVLVGFIAWGLFIIVIAD